MKIDEFIPLFTRFLKNENIYEVFCQCYISGLRNKVRDFLPNEYIGKSLTLRDFCIIRWGSDYDKYHKMNPFDKCLYLDRKCTDKLELVNFFLSHYFQLGGGWKNYAMNYKKN